MDFSYHYEDRLDDNYALCGIFVTNNYAYLACDGYGITTYIIRNLVNP